jgi:hypothetical protein
MPGGIYGAFRMWLSKKTSRPGEASSVQEQRV